MKLYYIIFKLNSYFFYLFYLALHAMPESKEQTEVRKGNDALNAHIRPKWPEKRIERKRIQEMVLPVMWEFVKNKVLPLIWDWKPYEMIQQGKLRQVELREIDKTYIAPSVENIHFYDRVKAPDGFYDVVTEFFNTICPDMNTTPEDALKFFMPMFQIELDYLLLYYGHRFEEETLISGEFPGMNPLVVMMLNRITIHLDPSPPKKRSNVIKELILEYGRKQATPRISAPAFRSARQWRIVTDHEVDEVIRQAITMMLTENWNHPVTINTEIEVLRSDADFDEKNSGALSQEQKERIKKKMETETGYEAKVDLIEEKEDPGFFNVKLKQMIRTFDYLVEKFFQSQVTNVRYFYELLLTGAPIVIRKEDYEKMQTGEFKDFSMFAKLFCHIMIQHSNLSVANMQLLCLESCHIANGNPEAANEALKKMHSQFIIMKGKFETAFKEELNEIVFTKPVKHTSRSKKEQQVNPRSDEATADDLRYALFIETYIQLKWYEREINFNPIGTQPVSPEAALQRFIVIAQREYEKNHPKKTNESKTNEMEVEPVSIIDTDRLQNNARKRINIVMQTVKLFGKEQLDHQLSKDCKMYINKLQQPKQN